MAKRFTDSDKWKDPWFEELSGIGMLFFFYYVDNCDCAGIWKGSFKQFCFMTGFKYSPEEMLRDFNGKVIKLENGSYFMPSFIKFQYGELRDNNNAHAGVIKSLKYNDIYMEIQSGYSSASNAIYNRLSLKRKKEIMAEDYYKCTYCGFSGDEHSLSIDHIVPRIKGGENEPYNLTTACVSCNSKKRDTEHGLFIKNNNLQDKVSEKLRAKLELIKTLSGANSPLLGAQDKDKDKDKDKDNIILNKGIDEVIIKQVNDEVFASYQFSEGYPRNVFDEYAREAWPIYFADENPNKKWKRFLANYIKNNKHRIRDHMSELSKVDKPISAYMKEFFQDEANV